MAEPITDDQLDEWVVAAERASNLAKQGIFTNDWRPGLPQILALIAEVRRLRKVKDDFAEIIHLQTSQLVELETWANRMPDAGLTVDDPRYSWWIERPCKP